MALQQTPFTAPLLVAAGTVAVAAYYVIRQQRVYEPVPGGYLAVGLSLAVAFTLLTYAIELGTVGLEGKLFWNKVEYIGAVPVPALLLFFTLRYTGYDEYLTRRNVALVMAVPVATIGLAFTNDVHHLVWAETDLVTGGGFTALVAEQGPASLLYALYGYALVTVSIVLLVSRAVNVKRHEEIYRRQVGFLVAGSLVPLVAAGMYVSGLNPFPRLNIALVSFGFTALAFSWGIARHGLFTLVPVASQTAVEQMDDAVIVIDVRGLVVNVNEAAAPFLEGDIEEATGELVEDVLRPVAVPPAPDTPTGESIDEVVTDPETGNHYQRVGTPLTDSRGTPMGQLIVLRDITDRIRREERLRQQNEQLEEFASVVSHDLRNPLNVISGRLQLARETGDEEHFDAIADATDRMDRLIDDLLQLARQGQTVGETEEVSLEATAEDAWRNVEAPEATFEVTDDLSVEADRDRLQQAFENLFRNAIDHVGPEVSIRVEPLEDGFAVEDDGPGIPEDEREEVLEYGHTTAEDGTGFGLAIVREIADAHGWEIAVTDGSRGGARFEITGATTRQAVALKADESGFHFG